MIDDILNELDYYDREELIIDQMIEWFRSRLKTKGEELREVGLLRKFGRSILRDFDCADDFLEYIKDNLDEGEVKERFAVEPNDDEFWYSVEKDKEARGLNGGY